MADNILSLDELIKLTASGINVASLADVRASLIQNYQDIFGSDIDLSTGTADGVDINNRALMIKSFLDTIQRTYQNLDIYHATGTSLDALAALANMYRLGDTYSQVSVNVQYTGSDTNVTFTPQEMAIIDGNGTIWQPKKSARFLDSTVSYSTIYYCQTAGPIACPQGFLKEFTNPTVELSFTQNGDAVVGRSRETDNELRSRLLSGSSSGAQTVLGGLKNALDELWFVDKVKLYNNNTNSNMTAQDGTTISPHSVYVILTLKDNHTYVDLYDAEDQIADVIYSHMTPGISTTESNSSSESISFRYQLAATIETIVNEIMIYWKTPAPIDPAFTIDLDPVAGLFDSTNTPKKIYDYVRDKLNSLSIGETFTANQIAAWAQMADPFANGRATYTVTSVSTSDVTIVNPDEYFYYKEYVESENWNPSNNSIFMGAA